jgi:hypothetical protein
MCIKPALRPQSILRFKESMTAGNFFRRWLSVALLSISKVALLNQEFSLTLGIVDFRLAQPISG